jgi:RNA polymerase sigma factor (TIGR02999 family)
MSEAHDEEVNRLLQRWSEGDEEAAARVFPLVYDELHRMASAMFRRERQDHTLQTTAVIHEAYLNLMKGRQVDWQNRAHFFGLMTRIMRRVLVDHARSHNRSKRGGGSFKVAIEEADGASIEESPDVVALDEALTRFSEIDPEKARVIELRFFGGLTIEETAVCLGISKATVIRQWRLARAWLYTELSEESQLES